MNGEKKNLFYKLRYTGWGRFLAFLLIIIISSGFGLGIMFEKLDRSEDEIINGFLDKELASEIGGIAGGHTVENSSITKYNMVKLYENQETLNESNKVFSEVDTMGKDEDNLVFIKGKYTSDGLVIEENNLTNKKILNEIEGVLKNNFKDASTIEEKTETINSNDKDYLEKIRVADTFSTSDGIIYSKADYENFTLEYEEREEGETDKSFVDDRDYPREQGGGYVYPTGEVQITTEKEVPLNSVKFAFTVNEIDILSNFNYIYPMQEVIMYGFFPGIALAMVLIISFNGLSKYYETKKIKYIKFLDEAFIDILAVTAIGILGTIMAIVSSYNWNNTTYQYWENIAIYGATSVYGLMLWSYFILVIKGIYNNGIVDTIKNKTFIVWIIKKVVKLVKGFTKYLKKQIKDVGTLGVGGSVLITAIAAFVVIFFTFLFRAGFEGWWFVLGLVALVLTYKLVYSVVKNIADINNKSEEIVNGNYDVKVNETMPYLKNIAHNFNTIGDNLTVSVEEQVKAERMRTELITNVSHDLKTPLTSIINYSKILTDEEATDEEKDEYAKVIHEKSLKLKTLIDDLFQISKASSNNIEFEYVKLDFSAMILQGIGEWKDHFEEKGLNIVFNKPEYPLVLMLDGNRTYRVVDNLMGNIFKYAQEGTRVYIDLVEEDEKVRLVVKNVSAYELNISSSELMERFTRGDKSRNTEGSGLGLSIASSLIEGQGGRFDIEIDGDLFKVIIEFNKIK